jgi:3'-phosphoadenosine 5'-phosphosulfate sulfotransferase (PAPS reductase)/FAD synthetase
MRKKVKPLDYAELKDLQSLPLKYKVMITKQRIQEWYEHWDGQVYVSFSGGKDSTVLLNIVRELYPDVPAVFVDTGLEYPEIRDFVKSIDNVVWLRPKMTFKRVIEKYGYPVVSKETSERVYRLRHYNLSERVKKNYLEGDPERGFGPKLALRWRILLDAPFGVNSYCCNVMKKEPIYRYEKETGRKSIIGTMADESRMRLQNYLEHGCNSFDSKRPRSTPLGFWTEQDVLQYLSVNNIPYATVYGEICGRGDQLITTGVKRTGCMFCMFGVHMEKEPNRFQRMQITHPKQWDYCMYNLGLKEVLEYIGVPYNNDNEGLWTTKDLIEMEC